MKAKGLAEPGPFVFLKNAPFFVPTESFEYFLKIALKLDMCAEFENECTELDADKSAFGASTGRADSNSTKRSVT
jgi:hypothetical protein